MARVTVSDVKAIADFGELSDSEISAFIDDANTIINDRAQSRISDAMLPKVEKWLAAHLAAMKEQTVRREGVGQSEIFFEGNTGLGLAHTRYGQQVKIMVPENVLVASSGMNYVRTVKTDKEPDSLDDADPNHGGAH